MHTQHTPPTPPLPRHPPFLVTIPPTPQTNTPHYPSPPSPIETDDAPSLHQIASETGTPLSTLLLLNPSCPSLSYPSTAPTHSAAAAPQTPARRSPRRSAHYVKTGFVCECARVALQRAGLLPPPHASVCVPGDAALLGGAEECGEGSWWMSGGGWGVGALVRESVGLRRSARDVRHFVDGGFVCECPHMRHVSSG